MVHDKDFFIKRYFPNAQQAKKNTAQSVKQN